MAPNGTRWCPAWLDMNNVRLAVRTTRVPRVSPVRRMGAVIDKNQGVRRRLLLAIFVILVVLIVSTFATGKLNHWWNGNQSLYHGQVMWNGDGFCNHLPSWLATYPGPGPVQ